MVERKIINDLTGKSFGRLTVISKTDKRSSGGCIMWLCKCSCGKYTEVITQSLNNGSTKSCGCLRDEKATKHGRNRTYIQRAYQAMKQRCYNKIHYDYCNYGGRGIIVCGRWMNKEKGFQNFIDDMGERPTNKHSLDRIDNDGNYSPKNCRWATWEQQNRNNRNNKLDKEKVEKIRKLLDEGDLNQREIADMFNICKSNISDIKNNKIWRI